MQTTRHREIVCGDFPDLELAFVERLQALRRSDALAPILVLLPTNLLRRHLSSTLAARAMPHINVRFITIDALVRDLTTLQLAEYSTMPKFADELLMAQACVGHGDEFYFANLADRPGLHRSLLASIRDLKEAGADVALLQSTLRQLEGLDKSAHRKLESLLQVFRRYEKLKREHGYWDEPDQYEAATRLIACGSVLAGIQALLVYGIYDFKRVQARLVLAAAEKLDTTVFFPFERTAAWEYAKPTLEMLLELGFSRTDAARRAKVRSESLQRLCDRLFGTPPSTLAEPIATSDHTRQSASDHLDAQIVSVPGETREALEIPRIVMELVRARDMRFSDVAILLRAHDPADRNLRDAFQHAGLPVSIPHGIPLRESRAARSMLLMIHVLQQDFARRDVMELLTFADLDFEPLGGLADPPTATWDALSMRAGIVRGREQWLRRLASLQRRLSHKREREKSGVASEVADPASESNVIAALIQTMHEIFGSLEAIARSRTWSELIDRTVQAFEKLIRTSCDRDEIMYRVAELRGLDALKPGPSLGMLARLVHETLQSDSSQQAERSGAGCTIIPLMQARGVPFRAVIVPGLIERSFPHALVVDPILLDHERQKLNVAFAELTTSPRRLRGEDARAANAPPSPAWLVELLPAQLPLKLAQVSEERLLYRLAIGAARERVVLTFPRIESESGRENVPSYFLLRTIDASVQLPSEQRVASGPAVSAPIAPPKPAGRGKKTRSRDQLVLSFDVHDRDSAAGGSGQIEAAAIARGEVESAGRRGLAPATVGSMACWPGYRYVPLSELAPIPSRAVSMAEHDLGAALAELRAGGAAGAVLGACASLSPHFARGLAAEHLRWGQRSFTRFDGRIEDDTLLTVLRRKSPLSSTISPSRIEDYARCPFHFFMHNLLGLEVIEEPELLAHADATAKGTLVHEILAEFLRTMKKRGRLPLAANHAKYLHAIARKYMTEFEESGAAGPALTWQIERAELLTFFEQFMQNEMDWQNGHGYRPAHFELPFGSQHVTEGLSSEPATFDLGDGQVLKFRGVIDRVDISADGKRLYVIDYKGRHVPNPGKDGFGLGTVVQLPIYLLGAQSALQSQGQFDAAGGKYISYQPEVDPVVIEKLNEKTEERLRSILRTIGRGIHAGLFMQYTGQYSCRYCPYDRVCMGIQDAVIDLKKGDPCAADYVEMKKGSFRLSGTSGE